MISPLLLIGIALLVLQEGESIDRKFANGTCPLGSFPCVSTDECILQANWCDETVDCSDSSDEMSCVDMLANEVINRKHRKRPGADTDELPRDCDYQRALQMTTEQPTNYSSLALTTLHATLPKCECIKDNIICRHLHLYTAPSINDLFNDVQNKRINLLDLGGNIFHRMSRDSLAELKDLRIRTLVLQHCSIVELEGGPFGEVLQNGLQNLHLDGNRLRTLRAEVFDVPGNNLELLSIGHNSISSIDAAAFRHLEGLMELDLRYNQIERLNADWFVNLYTLQTLHLQGNLLTQLDASSWPSRGRWPRIGIHERSVELHLQEALEVVDESLATRPEDFDGGVNRMASLTPPIGLEQLETLSLAANRLQKLADGGFAAAPMARSLNNLDLSENFLETISNATFMGLSNLLGLTLNQNALRTIDDDAFIWMPNLTSLDLQNNKDVVYNPRIFANLRKLEYLYFDIFEKCANAPHVKVCEPKGDGISSKENLLDSIVLRASVWIMAFIGFLGNLIVLLGRQFITKHTNIVDSLHIKNLAVSDLLMSIYLFVIASVDVHFRGEYLEHERLWRRSTWCTFSGFLNTLSCESSVLILSLVTWDRYVSVTRPFPRNQMSFKFVMLRLVTLWMIAIGVAALPILHQTRGYFGDEFYNANGVCLPLYLHNPYGKGWQYSVVLFVCVNLTALAFISYAYLRMIREIRVSTVACRSTQQTQVRDRVAQHLGIIVFTDCLCWVPVIAIKMATLSGFELSRSYRNFVYASLAIYIMPINSALNPILYTFATPLFKKQVRKLMQVCCQRQKRTDAHSGYDTAMSLSLGMLGSNSRRVLTYRVSHYMPMVPQMIYFEGTQTSHTGSKNSWRKQPQAV